MVSIDEKTVQCPYDPSHVILEGKLDIHLAKCKKQNPQAVKFTCVFKSNHIVDEVEKNYHTNTCCSRDVLDNMIYRTDDDHRPVVPVQPAPVVQCEENWDEDSNASYAPDPWKNPHIIKKVKGATKSERRKARLEGIKSYRPLPMPDEE